jgi:hypothetical protein
MENKALKEAREYIKSIDYSQYNGFECTTKNVVEKVIDKYEEAIKELNNKKDDLMNGVKY